MDTLDPFDALWVAALAAATVGGRLKRQTEEAGKRLGHDFKSGREIEGLELFDACQSAVKKALLETLDKAGVPIIETDLN